MRLWHLVFGILLLALGLTLARDLTGRVAVIVFVVGLAEAATATAALMVLFETVGAIGEARTLADHAIAVAATTLVLAVATLIMAALFALGIWVVLMAVT